MAKEELSKSLHEVLDVIGVSEYTRKQYWEFAMLNEIPDTFASQLYDKQSKTASYYTVGSACEGTTSPGLNSDIDCIICKEDSYVVDNIVESKQRGISYLILTDENTKPGYVHLQIIEDKCPVSVQTYVELKHNWFYIDLKGRFCVKPSRHEFVRRNSSRNGPADTIPADCDSCGKDLVYALRCRQIPKSVNSWLHRKRKYDWPSHRQLKAMGSYGCFLVGVGHPHSPDNSVEWRISFSLQERNLMSSLTETQHKCYVLLKMIKQYIIESKVGKSISSYHCKTSLFYTIENTHSHIWTDGNLINCAGECLKRLFIWVKAKNCPNYFIPEDNMFDKLSSMTLNNVEKVLNELIDGGVNPLYSLTCDNVGGLLKAKMCGSELVCNNTSKYTLCNATTGSVYKVRNMFLRRLQLSYKTFTCFLNGTRELLLYLQHTNHVTEHTTTDVRMAFDSLIPHIHLQHDQCMPAKRLLPETMPDIIAGTSSDCDLISLKLAHASMYIQSKKLDEKCKRILVSCENSLEPYVISACTCNTQGIYLNIALIERLRVTDMSSKDFRRHCTIGCMAFMSCQAHLVHEALQYELFRNVFTEPGSETEMIEDHWIDWIIVDSRIYLYFLQVLLYSYNRKGEEKGTAVQKLVRILVTDPNLRHRETGYNLLGWICHSLQANYCELQGCAWGYFCKSWKIRPFRNAAKWHMLILLSEVIKGGG